MNKKSSSSIKEKSKFICPACDKSYLSLGQLDFHLNHGCFSRTTETTELNPQQDNKRSKQEFVNLIEDEEQEEAPRSSIGKMSHNEVVESKLIANPPPSSKSSLKYIYCPGCSQRILMEALDFHLEKSCSSRKDAFLPKLVLQPTDKQSKPPGLVLLENFITLEEEEHLVALIEATDDWKLSIRNGRCDMKHWGICIDYSSAKPRTRYPDPEKGEKEMPDFFTFLLKRFEQYPPLSAWWPNEANANRYIKSENHFLTPHFDDRRLSGEIICNISLLSDCIMTFAKPESTGSLFRVRLPRLCASVMSRSSRYDYTHAINHEDLLGPKRISLNFRQQTEPTGMELKTAGHTSN